MKIVELERLEYEEGLTKDRMDLIEFQKDVEHKMICKKINEKHLEFLQNNDLEIKDILLIKKFCEFAKGR